MAKQISLGGYLIKQFGAYIRTDLSGLTDINGVASNIIGMIGLAEKGPLNQAVTITSYTQLVDTFGDGPLVRHGLAAYVGGANQLICVRTGKATQSKLTAIDIAATTSNSYSWSAKDYGTLGNNIQIASILNTKGTVPTNDDTLEIDIKYIDSSGNDIRENYIFPAYIPNPVYTDSTGATAYRYYNNNTTDYYVLYNNLTGEIREIPNTWGYGNATQADFVQQVDNLKSTSESLLGPFPYGTGTNSYPLALIQAVINNGGLGMTSSSLVALSDTNPTMAQLLTAGYVYDAATADVIIEHAYISLSGGTNGDDGTGYYNGGLMTWDQTASTVMNDSWVTSLALFESEEVNFIQPAYLFNYTGTSTNSTTWAERYGFYKTLMPLFLAHINTLSNIPNRMFRSMITGMPYYLKGDTANKTAADFLDATQDISGVINSDRVQLWAGGFKSSAFSSSVEDYGGEMLASFVVGAQAARDVATSLTFAQLAGIFTDGLEFSFTQSQRDELYTRAWDFVKKRRTSTGALEYIAANNYTSFTGAPSRGLQLFMTRRIVDYMNTFLYKNLEENFIGATSRGTETAARIKNYTEALLGQLVSEGVLVAYANIVVTPNNDLTVYAITFDFQPVTEVDFIPVTNRLLYNLA